LLFLFYNFFVVDKKKEFVIEQFKRGFGVQVCLFITICDSH